MLAWPAQTTFKPTSDWLVCSRPHGRPDEAAGLYRRALELDPNSPSALLDLAWILASQPETKELADAILRRLRAYREAAGR